MIQCTMAKINKVHYQICFINDGITTKRLTIYMFRKWLRYLYNDGRDIKINYDSAHHTYLATIN